MTRFHVFRVCCLLLWVLVGIYGEDQHSTHSLNYTFSISYTFVYILLTIPSFHHVFHPPPIPFRIRSCRGRTLFKHLPHSCDVAHVPCINWHNECVIVLKHKVHVCNVAHVPGVCRAPFAMFGIRRVCNGWRV